MILGSWKISLKSPKIELEVLFGKEKKSYEFLMISHKMPDTVEKNCTTQGTL